jgi:hypothetical protein
MLGSAAFDDAFLVADFFFTSNRISWFQKIGAPRCSPAIHPRSPAAISPKDALEHF